MFSAIIAVLFLFADQLIKYWTVNNIELNTGIRELFPGILHMTYIKNFGAAFGLFSNVPWLRWALLGLLVCFTLFILLGVRRGGYLRTGFARFTGLMLLAGLLGNGIDRAIYGYVVDMFEVEFINFAIFNLADVLVVFFGILFCIALIAGGIGSPDRYEDDEDDYPRAHRGSSRQEPHRSHSNGQARRSSGSGQSAKRSSGSGSGQQARRPSGSGSSQQAQRSSGSGSGQQARRPRPADSGMSVRPLVPVQKDAPRPEAPAETRPEEPKTDAVQPAQPVNAPAEPKVDSGATRPFQPVSAPAEPKVDSGATRPFQPVSAPAEPKVDSGATRPFQPVSAPAEPKVDSGATRPFPPVSAPAEPKAPSGDTQVYTPTAKPAAKSTDDFDLDSILAEFK